MSSFVITCVMLLVMCSVAVRAQLPSSVAQPTSMLTVAVDPTFVPQISDDYAQCPAGTAHVVVAVPVRTTQGVTYPPMSMNYSIGCCPLNTYACYDQNDNRILACQSKVTRLGVVNSAVPVCCLNAQGQVIGAGYTAVQCCGNTICPDGFLCCGGKCCPVPSNSDVNDVNGTCTLDPNGNPAGCRISASNICAGAQLQVVCPNATFYNQSCPSAQSPCVLPNCSGLCPVNQSSCLFPSKYLYNITCPPTPGACIYYNIPIKQCPSQVVGCVNNVTQIQIPVGCINVPSSGAPPTCTYLVGGVPTFVGVADGGRTCCGPFICSPGTQCCSHTQLVNTIFANQTANATVYDGCCPVSTDPSNPIACCTQNIMNQFDTRYGANSFCGRSGLPGTGTCERNILSPAAFYAFQIYNRRTSLP